jgi:hypothetical protein
MENGVHLRDGDDDGSDDGGNAIEPRRSIQTQQLKLLQP